MSNPDDSGIDPRSNLTGVAWMNQTGQALDYLIDQQKQRRETVVELAEFLAKIQGTSPDVPPTLHLAHLLANAIIRLS